MLCICITLAVDKSQNDYKYKSNVHKYPHVTIVVFKWLAKSAHEGGTAQHRGSICTSHPAILVSILRVPIFLKFNVAEINRQ